MTTIPTEGLADVVDNNRIATGLGDRITAWVRAEEAAGHVFRDADEAVAAALRVAALGGLAR